MEVIKKIWAEQGGRYYLTQPSVEHKQLENQVYTVNVDNNGNFYLSHVCESFTFDYKLYGLETKLINRVIKTYTYEEHGNLGVLLNGVKGTGKTVSSKIISNKLNQPTIIVSAPFNGVQYFLNSIPQNITIFIDEYEKIYGQSNEMLTIMDGAMNSEYRRVFLMTTNKLYIEDNLKERPSRVRYIKTFDDLSPSTVEEIVDDILIHKQFKDDCLRFMTTLSLITVDIVKSVINEVNIHEESPFDFGEVFNISKNDGKYQLYELDASGKQGDLLADNAKVYPRPDFNIDEHEGYWFEINGKSIGRVVEVLGPDVIVVDIIDYDDEQEVVTDTIILKIARSYDVHSNYAWTGVGSNANTLKTNDKLDILMGNDPKRSKGKKSKSAILKAPLVDSLTGVIDLASLSSKSVQIAPSGAGESMVESMMDTMGDCESPSNG